ncbi:beta-galactosidase-1-like protein 3 isoform X7 [Rhinolophus ferrumequinum]|uniref:beta-galactosidase-1-like protein 3 isoform X7 n=1 Tax=Rhinolophus ferrumequinum TaxID=59479 RepID=UPI00140FD3D0|nr:beta-galactosidase-1-like protein 3 isoform X7 [Rhinolophus ferrumequinum]
MDSSPRFSTCLSWKRIVCSFFLPFILSGLAPSRKYKEYLISGEVRPQLPQYSRFNWSHLTPLELKNRSMGLQTESIAGSNPYFTLGGHKFLIFGGSIHYFRVPRAYWRDRLLKLKACGFNTVTTYVPWNLHEPQRGKFDFSGNLDLEAFVLMAAEIGLWVILRPGPYICSEIDLGGLPSWLLQDPNLRLRTTDNGFVEAVNQYFDHLMARVVPLQRNKPIMVMEYWVGWFDTWGSGEHKVTNADDVEKTVSEFIKFEISFNIYMFHGGTNFGFINGAINFGRHTGVVTSYDYDAVLTEAGDYTNKYFKLRKLFGSILAFPLPPLPEITLKAVYPAVRPSLYLPLWDVLKYLNEPVISNKPVNMENLPINNGNGQSYGFILYETPICSGGELYADVQDTAQVGDSSFSMEVFLNETSIGMLNDDNQNLNIPEVRECQLLRVLVENQGRVNFSWKIQDQRKGLIGSITINNIPVEGYTIYSLEMKMNFFERLRSATWRPVPNNYLGPAFYLGTLKAGSSPKDTFLRPLNWNYGFVFINGHNLGRYWCIGPQETLYLPGAWLHPEDNEIILFEKSKSGSDIQTIDGPML